jgi:carbamoyl-phosphate synthase/aspartate carbamoyltransferase/dihydroorotase
MALTRLPALVDVHVHVREPGATYKEDWDSATAAALAGGISAILAMPNTQPAITDEARLAVTQQAAETKARCDYAHYLGGSVDNAQPAAALAGQVAGLKLYLDQTYGDLKLDRVEDWEPHFAAWPPDSPLCVHAEGATMEAAIQLAARHQRPLHICHVSRQDEIEMIRVAKERGQALTCEVTPHHLFLCEDDIPALGAGRAEVRPRLATAADRDALWANLDVIDCFASDHAPHTLEEKDGPNPPPGFAGLETMLPLLLTAVSQGRLTLEDLTLRLSDQPRRIFGLPAVVDSYVEVDLEARNELQAVEMHGRCGWTPFEGHPVQGRVQRVVLRGTTVFADGRVLAAPGSGRNLRRLQNQ